MAGTGIYAVLTLTAKLGATMALNITYLFTAQLYPTSIRFTMTKTKILAFNITFTFTAQHYPACALWLLFPAPPSFGQKPNQNWKKLIFKMQKLWLCKSWKLQKTLSWVFCFKTGISLCFFLSMLKEKMAQNGPKSASCQIGYFILPSAWMWMGLPFIQKL